MSKKYQMDKVSASFAKDLDKRRDENKRKAQQAATRRSHNRTSLSRGGFR